MTEIREATIDDVDQVFQLWRELLKDQLGKDEFYNGSLDFAGEGQKKQILQSILSDDCGMFVSILDGKIVGYGEICLNCEGFNVFNDEAAYIVHFYFNEKGRHYAEAFRLIDTFFKTMEKWIKSKGKRYMISDVFYHNMKVVKLLCCEKAHPYRVRMVEHI